MAKNTVKKRLLLLQQALFVRFAHTCPKTAKTGSLLCNIAVWKKLIFWLKIRQSAQRKEKKSGNLASFCDKYQKLLCIFVQNK